MQRLTYQNSAERPDIKDNDNDRQDNNKTPDHRSKAPVNLNQLYRNSINSSIQKLQSVHYNEDEMQKLDNENKSKDPANFSRSLITQIND